MKIEFTKHGLKHDYRGAHVAYDIAGRHYLGTIVGVYRSEVPAVTMLRVRHFNGEDAPDVAAAFVEVLEREGFAPFADLPESSARDRAMARWAKAAR